MAEKNYSILLVEDDENFGDVLRSYLEMHDFSVTLMKDGMQGYDAYKKGSYDLCIFDVMMPKKDGFSLAKDIRESDKEIPIIFLTARAMKEDVIQGFKLGADDYITKPFSQKLLSERIRTVLRIYKNNKFSFPCLSGRPSSVGFISFSS